MGILDKLTGQSEEGSRRPRRRRIVATRRQARGEKGEAKEERDQAREHADEKAEEAADLERKT